MLTNYRLPATSRRLPIAGSWWLVGRDRPGMAASRL